MEAAIDQVCAIARKAGAATLAYYGPPANVARKADGSPVSEADYASHEVIAGALAEWDPMVPVISEEAEVPPFEVRRHWPTFWLVDPLDGTKEFLSQNGEFTVNIARIEDGVPVLGVVYAPALDLLYYGGANVGSFKVARGVTTRLFGPKDADGRPLVIVESRSHPSAELERFLLTIRVARRVQAGSSLKFCWVAEGVADLYPRFGRTMEWDVAAGDSVWRYATPHGSRPSPLRYNTPDLSHLSFVVGVR